MVGAVLLWALTPVMACLVPCIAPAPAKDHCAHEMAMDCEHSMTAANDACCQAPSWPRSLLNQDNVSEPLKHILTQAIFVANIAAPDVLTEQPASPVFFASPPDEGAPLSPTVLRI